MALRLELTPAVTYPALWLPERHYRAMSAQDLLESLEAVRDEVLADVGGLAALVRAVSWTETATLEPPIQAVHPARIERALRESRTLKEAAATLGIDQSTLWRWRHGRNRPGMMGMRISR